MKKFILKITLLLISLTGFSQSYSDVSYNSATSGAWDGISADCTVGIKITTSQGGIYCDHHLQSFNLKTLRIAQKDIPASQVPSNVILDKRVDITFDLYVNNVFIERNGQPSVSWAKLQGLPNSDSYKPATSENGYKLFNSGAITIRNVKISKLHYRVDETYQAQIRNEIAGKNNKNTTENLGKQGNSTSLTIENNSSNNNPVTQTGTTSNGVPANTSGNDPLAHFETDGKPKSNPMLNQGNSGSSAVDKFAKNYEKGQQISDALTPLLDAWSKKIDRDNAKHVAYQEDRMREGAIRTEQYNSYCAETNKKLLNWEYYQKNVIQKIPFLLKSTSPKWESILGSEKLAVAFGKDAQFIVKNFNSYDYGNRQVLIKLKKESLNREKIENIAIKENSSPINYFYSVDVGVHYRYKYFMNGVNISDTHFHNCGFIYNANNIVIGIYINIATSVWGNSKNIHSYFMDILSKIGNEYIMLDANTFLVKDKLIFIEYDVIRMFDLKYFNQTLLLKKPLIYSTVDNSKLKYKVAGVKFKLDDVKIVDPSFLKKQNIIEQNESNVKGIIIGEVIKKSNAEKAGLQANDIITVVNGFTVKSPYVFQLIVQGYSSEGKLNVSYIRDGIEYNTIMNFE